MISFLGTRGKVAAGVVAATALTAASASLARGDWATAAVLTTLGATWVVAAGTWGVARAVHAHQEALTEKINRLQGPKGARKPAANADLAELRSSIKKLADDVNTLAVRLAGAETGALGKRSLEQRYAGVLTQPASVPNSQLLGYLELLAKDATARRADMAAIREMLDEIRKLRESDEMSF